MSLWTLSAYSTPLLWVSLPPRCLWLRRVSSSPELLVQVLVASSRVRHCPLDGYCEGQHTFLSGHDPCMFFWHALEFGMIHLTDAVRGFVHSCRAMIRALNTPWGVPGELQGAPI
mmetsp:Transcript_168727/g.536517  ORF Transcript_168727/g.536517 Transcript_168727/m.536517 type:complete len:115 (+) Transcript_168727:1217-1561(+)